MKIMYVTYTMLCTKHCGQCLCLEISHIWEVTRLENVRHIKMISEIDSIFIESFLYIVQPNAKVEWNTVVITLETIMLLN